MTDFQLKVKLALFSKSRQILHDDFIEEDGDEIITPMPRLCQKWGCTGAPLEINKDGFMVCPNCGGSYGKAATTPTPVARLDGDL